MRCGYHTWWRRAAVLALALSLSGCGAVLGSGDIETFLRAPRLSGEASGVQKALNSYLGSTAALKYPASGDFLSPFLFGDWDGDGMQEAAVLYTSDSVGSNVCMAVLEPSESSGWMVAQTVEGLSGSVESVNTAHLRDTDSLQILVGYGSAQGDRYLVVYQYTEDKLHTIIKQNYTDMILANITGTGETQDLILTLPTETENGGVNLQLLTYVGGEFRSAQTLAVGEGSYNGCAGLHAGAGGDGSPYLVVDGWVGTSANSLASTIIIYDEETGFLKAYTPPGVVDLYRATLRYETSLLSIDLDGNGTIDIPTELDDGGVVAPPADKQLYFLLWKDYFDASEGNTHFGVYDSKNRFFLALPESMHGSVQLRSNAAGTGWLICNADSSIIYCELRVANPSDDAEEYPYQRIATIGSQQLQARIVTSYYGLSLEDIAENTVLME